MWTATPASNRDFKTFIDFPDYAPADLIEIFRGLCAQNGMELPGKASQKLAKAVKALHARRGKGFGNGRAVRNLFEVCMERQAERLATTNNVSKEALSRLTDADIPAPEEVS